MSQQQKLRVDILSDNESILSNESPLSRLKSLINFTLTGTIGLNVGLLKLIDSKQGFVLIDTEDIKFVLEILKMTRSKCKVLICSEKIGFASSLTRKVLFYSYFFIINCLCDVSLLFDYYYYFIIIIFRV
jgi:hypothetical protein